MIKIFFENTIEYNENVIDFQELFYKTINLSTLLHINNNAHSSKFFNLSKILKPLELVKIHYNGEYHVFVQPDFEKLVKPFGFILKRKTFTNKEEANELYKKYLKNTDVAIQHLRIFVAERNEFLELNDVRLFNDFFKENWVELRTLIKNINSTLGNKTINLIDYKYEDGKLQIKKYQETVPYFFNFTSIKNFFYDLALSNNEYYNYHYDYKNIVNKYEETKKELLKDPTNYTIQTLFKMTEQNYNFLMKKIDEINDCSLFNRETFALLCLALEPFVKKEEALNEFIYKVINNELSTFCITENFKEKNKLEIRNDIEKVVNLIIEKKIKTTEEICDAISSSCNYLNDNYIYNLIKKDFKNIDEKTIENYKKDYLKKELTKISHITVDIIIEKLSELGDIEYQNISEEKRKNIYKDFDKKILEGLI